MATIRSVTLPTGETYTMSDWGDYPLYSRAQIQVDQVQDVTIFNYTASQEIPGGAAGVRATIADTNMPQPGQLPLRHQMVVFAVQCRFDEADSDTAGLVRQPVTVAEGIAKWNNIVQNIYFQLVVENTKPYVEGPVTAFPAGGGLYLIKSDHLEGCCPTPSPTPSIWAAYNINNGEPGAHASRRLAQPLHLGSMENFVGTFRFPRGALPSPAATHNEYGLTIVLNGPRQRPVG
jgi:hypothetical protein